MFPNLWLELCDINDGCVCLWLCLVLLLVDALDFTILIVSDGRGHAGPVDFASRLGSPMMSLGIPVAAVLLLLWRAVVAVAVIVVYERDFVWQSLKSPDSDDVASCNRAYVPTNVAVIVCMWQC